VLLSCGHWLRLCLRWKDAAAYWSWWERRRLRLHREWSRYIGLQWSGWDRRSLSGCDHLVACGLELQCERGELLHGQGRLGQRGHGRLLHDRLLRRLNRLGCRLLRCLLLCELLLDDQCRSSREEVTLA
jgi:hypothetical protein